MEVQAGCLQREQQDLEPMLLLESNAGVLWGPQTKVRLVNLNPKSRCLVKLVEGFCLMGAKGKSWACGGEYLPQGQSQGQYGSPMKYLLGLCRLSFRACTYLRG